MIANPPARPSWFLRSLLWSLVAIPAWLYLGDWLLWGDRGAFAPRFGEPRTGLVVSPLCAAITLVLAVVGLIRGKPSAGQIVRSLLGFILAGVLLFIGAVWHIISKPGFANGLR